MKISSVFVAFLENTNFTSGEETAEIFLCFSTYKSHAPKDWYPVEVFGKYIDKRCDNNDEIKNIPATVKVSAKENWVVKRS